MRPAALTPKLVCGLHENLLHELIDLNTWSLIGGTVWEDLRGVALLEEICHGGGQRVQAGLKLDSSASASLVDGIR